LAIRRRADSRRHAELRTTFEAIAIHEATILGAALSPRDDGLVMLAQWLSGI